MFIFNKNTLESKKVEKLQSQIILNSRYFLPPNSFFDSAVKNRDLILL